MQLMILDNQPTSAAHPEQVVDVAMVVATTSLDKPLLLTMTFGESLSTISAEDKNVTDTAIAVVSEQPEIFPFFAFVLDLLFR